MGETGAGKQVLGLAVCIGVVLAAGGIGSLFTADAARTWYQEIEKPSWTPPDWVFAPVWTALYLMTAVAAWLVWRRWGFGPGRAALALFIVQLALNAGWTPIFFGLRAFGVAFVEIVVLWCAILATLVAFARLSAPAAWLMVPYLLWVTYASTLNLGVWWLNR